MKAPKYRLLARAGTFCAILLWSLNCVAAEPRKSWQEQMPSGNATADIRAAQGQLKAGGQEFTGTANATAPAVNVPLPLTPATNSTAPTPTPPKKNAGKKPAPPREPIIYGTGSITRDPRGDAIQGSPETGYAGTWTDPATKDTITTVIAPIPQTYQQEYPVIIEPQVYPGNWSGSGGTSAWGSGNWNSGWDNQSTHWPQWPGYPGDSGYLPPPPPPPAHFNNSRPNMRPPQHFNPGFAPSFPPPQHPGYRPLRPNNPSIWHPNQPGFHPGMPGGQPPFGGPGNKPGFNPGMPGAPGMNPGMPGTPPYPGGQPPFGGNKPGFNPGAPSVQPPFGGVGNRPGFNPGMPGGQPPFGGPGHNPGINGPGGAPNFRPLPMRPGGNSWGGPRPGGGF